MVDRLREGLESRDFEEEGYFKKRAKGDSGEERGQMGEIIEGIEGVTGGDEVNDKVRGRGKGKKSNSTIEIGIVSSTQWPRLRKLFTPSRGLKKEGNGGKEKREADPDEEDGGGKVLGAW